MNLILLTIFTFILFTFLTIFRKWIDGFVLALVAIGCSINALVYTAMSHPFSIGSIPLGIDSILYTLFIYSVFLKVRKRGIKEGWNLTITAIAAIILSAVIEFFILSISRDGFCKERLIYLLNYVSSILGTFLGVYLMFLFYSFGEKRNMSFYIMLPICLLIASCINTIFYYGTYALIYKTDINTLLSVLLGNLIGKGICLVFSEIGYFINDKYLVPAFYKS